MGLLDRDHANDPRRERPFAAATARGPLGTLLMAIVFVVSLSLLYKFADWSHDKQVREAAERPVASPATVASSDAAGAAALNVANGLQALSQGPPAAVVQSSGYIVTKCTVNGKVSYGDSPCARGAVTTLVTTRPDHNIIASSRAARPLPLETAFSPAPVIAQSNTASTHSTHSTLSTPSAHATHATQITQRAECRMLDARIKSLDDQRRQPQTAQAKDSFDEEQKATRDLLHGHQCP